MTTFLLVVLSLLGVGAIVLRLVRATGRMLVYLAESTAASGLAEVSARRGDLTAYEERRERAAELRRAGRRRVAIVAFWITLLLLPIALGQAHRLYPLAALLWLLPLRPIRGT